VADATWVFPPASPQGWRKAVHPPDRQHRVCHATVCSSADEMRGLADAVMICLDHPKFEPVK
jgi:hypothetical protein